MGRPRVIVWGQASVDGRLTLAPGVLLLFGDERWPAGRADVDIYRWLVSTHRPDAFLEGSSSLVVDGSDPEPLPPAGMDAADLYVDYLPDAVVRRSGHLGWFAVVDSRGRIRWAYKEWPAEEWKGWHVLVLVARSTPAPYLAYLRREEIPYLVAGAARVDLLLALEKLGARLGVCTVVSTSPGRLGGALLRAGLVDEVNVEFLPALIGGYDTPSLFQCPPLQPGEWPAPLGLLSAHVQEDGRVWLRYEVRERHVPEPADRSLET
jgi:2,5-diamino-6-(ribosylamino)-4(3H)-pyrimidinone 5'-phosphate reductase